MPFTPFHFGSAAAINSLAPKRVSFLAFCAANTLIDVEPLYFMLTDNMPLHRFFHTGIGATLVALSTVLLFLVCRRFAADLRLPDWMGWRELALPAVIGGALLGTYTHILLDSFMHSDVYPFAPFSRANPLLNTVSMPALHWACALSGVLGTGVLWGRHYRLNRRKS